MHITCRLWAMAMSMSMTNPVICKLVTLKDKNYPNKRLWRDGQTRKNSKLKSTIKWNTYIP